MIEWMEIFDMARIYKNVKSTSERETGEVSKCLELVFGMLVWEQVC